MKQQKKNNLPQAGKSIEASPSGAVGAMSSAAVLTREEAEPTAAKAALPVLLIALLGVLLYWGDIYLMDHGGQFDARVYEPYKSVSDLPKPGGDDAATKGKLVYGQVCVACHQPTGAGLAGQFPPLSGSEWVNAEGPNRIIRIVLNGLIGPIDVKGQQFNNNMLAWKDTLSDQQIADVLTYVRNEWGNKAANVTPEQVKKVRDQEKDRGEYWTAPELLKISEKE